MAFTHKLPEAADRHLRAADVLYDDPGHRKGVAGYLYGIAAECAIKHLVIGLPLPPTCDRNAIFHAHFPELRTLLRDALGRRKGIPLQVFIDDDSFMNNWHIGMRYADARQIRLEWVDAWRRQARNVVNAMGAG